MGLRARLGSDFENVMKTSRRFLGMCWVDERLGIAREHLGVRWLAGNRADTALVWGREKSMKQASVKAVCAPYPSPTALQNAGALARTPGDSDEVLPFEFQIPLASKSKN